MDLQHQNNYSLKKEYKDFFEINTKIINIYPFKWCEFMSFFKFENAIFIKNTTLIINLLSFDIKTISRVFEIFKMYLDSFIIEKIIYKKEFMIVNFKEEYFMQFFKEENKWLIIPYVNLLNERFCVTLDKVVDDHIFDVCFKQKEYYYLYTSRDYIIYPNAFKLTFTKSNHEGSLYFSFSKKKELAQIVNLIINKQDL